MGLLGNLRSISAGCRRLTPTENEGLPLIRPKLGPPARGNRGIQIKFGGHDRLSPSNRALNVDVVGAVNQASVSDFFLAPSKSFNITSSTDLVKILFPLMHATPSGDRRPRRPCQNVQIMQAAPFLDLFPFADIDCGDFKALGLQVWTHLPPSGPGLTVLG